jgi:hypothetical protein
MIQYIYVLKDPISNEIRYVGKSNNPEKRLKRHLSRYGLIESWTPKNKWILYLKNNNLEPIMEVIDSTTGDINELEIKWIKHYRDLGLNLTNSTDGGDGFDWTGVKHRPETLEKMRLCHPNRKEVIQFDLDNKIINFFRSFKEAERVTSLDRSQISGCCRNKKHYITVGGFYFRTIDNYFPCIKSDKNPDMDYINSEIDNFNLMKTSYLTKKDELNNKLKESSKSKRKPVTHYDLSGNVLGDYDSISEASVKTGCHISLISNCCKSKYYTVSNTTFRYKNDVFDYEPYVPKNHNNSPRKICKYDISGNLLKIFDSIKQAISDSKSNYDNIIKCCKKKYRKNGEPIQVKGFIYRYLEDHV